MKIVNLETFLKIPIGTVYSKYSPCVFEGLMIKRENSGIIDFFYVDLIGNIDSNHTGDFLFKCEEAERKGNSLKLDFEIMVRDAMYEKYQLFAVYEKEDIDNLIKALQGGFNNAYDK